MSLRIIFCGTPSFACPFLQALHDDHAFEVTAVFTQPDKPTGREKKLSLTPVKELAKTLGISVMQPEDINQDTDLQATSYKLQADFLVVVAYGQILSPEVLTQPKIAPVNVHASLLPRWRGASPIQNAILAGDKKTGITIQRMTQKLDAGPILATSSIDISSRETKPSLEGKLSILGAKLLTETLKAPLHETPQVEAEATFCKKLTRESGEVDSKTMTAEEIDRRVRALVPWPGVVLKDLNIKLLETSLEPHPEALLIPCARNTTLYALKVQPPTKRVMTGAEWERGNVR